jgi:tRNA(Ile)-lysidine synthetase-like protein
VASGGAEDAPGKRKSRRGKAQLAGVVRDVIVREGLFPAGSRTVVMVSGGRDSIALLAILAAVTGRAPGPAFLHALHVNHHLRGSESDDDEALVVRGCEALGVGLSVLHRPVSKTGGNVQERARDARREAALQLAAELDCDRIAVGHTADDQVETMLYRLGRYGGLPAFRAMLPCDPPWVRPLLESRRAETAAYCRQHGLEFAEDRGNAYPGYARTALRQEVLPAWEEALPGAVEAAGRAAQVAGELERLTADLLDEAEQRVALPGGNVDRIADAQRGRCLSGPRPALSVAGLLALHPALRRLLLHRWLEWHASRGTESGVDGTIRQPRDCTASRASVLAVESLLERPGSAERRVGGWTAVKEYDRLSLVQGRPEPAQASPPVPLTVPGRADWGDSWVSAAPAERYLAPDVAREAFVDAHSLSGALEVRGPLPGDRMRPLGAPGTRRLQDILVDLKIPAAVRPRVPLVVCAGRVVWVCGLLVAEEGRITAETTRIVHLRIGRNHEVRGREGDMRT